MGERITPRQFHEADGVQDRRVLGEGACAWFGTGSFAAGARLVHAIGELAGLDDHHPDVDLRHGGVTVRLLTITDDHYGLSERDVELARQISALAPAAQPGPHRRVGAARPRRGPHRGGNRRRRPPGNRRARAVVVGARRHRGQRGLRGHLDEPRPSAAS
jgi:pterin-4a-carbinolamine dehydratase